MQTGKELNEKWLEGRGIPLPFFDSIKGECLSIGMHCKNKRDYKFITDRLFFFVVQSFS